jgi:glycine/D-amino acid oxidase-like deaminating enzyme
VDRGDGIPAGGFDVVVAGGGIVGLAIARWSARARLRVAVCERDEEIAAGASGASFAWVNATAKADDERYHALNAAGVAAYARLAAELGPATIGLHGVGSLQWTDRAEPLARLRHDHDALRRLGDAPRWLAADELRALLPGADVPRAAAGLLAPNDRWLDVPAFARWLVRELRAAGGRVIKGCEVLGVTGLGGGGIGAVETSAGTLPARRLVAAAGTATEQLVERLTGGRVRIPVDAVRGVLVETPPIAPAARPPRLVLWPADRDGVQVRAAPAGGLLLGSEASDDWDDDARIVDHLLAGAARAVPGLAAESLRPGCRVHTPYRPVPADGRPVVGSLAGAPGLYVAVTHSGVTLAPALGELVAGELAGGSPSASLAPYRPERWD